MLLLLGDLDNDENDDQHGHSAEGEHIGYRELKDKEKLVTERHRYNLESVDGKIKEFVVASPEQQQVIDGFTASSTKTHLVLEGPAGTGKTLVALQVANNLIESFNATSEEDKGPVLVVTAHEQEKNTRS